MPRHSQITKTISINMNNSGRVGKLDRKDYLILNELLMNAEATSFDISKKLKMPLSTVQRRRTALEHSSLIRKSYELDAKQLGWRTADILIAVEKGDCVEIANRLLTENIGIRLSSDISKKINRINDGSYGPRVIETSLRIGDPVVNVVARVIYRTSDELFHIIQEIKKMPNIARVEWSEIVKVVGTNDALVLTAV
jgi:DNA-binding Lrp family transcriptional regulator